MQRYALPFEAVERVVRAVAITPLPGAPRPVCGIINVHGKIIPVVNVRSHFGLPARAVTIDDRMIIANTKKRKLALLVDDVLGVTTQEDDDAVFDDQPAITRGGAISGIVKLADGMILIHDLESCLSVGQEHALDHLLGELKDGNDSSV